MKVKILLSCAIPLIFATSFVHAQEEEKESFSIIAGPTVQFFKAQSTETGFGYYLGIKPEVSIKSWIGVGSQIFFMQQFGKAEDVSLKNSSVNASFFVALKPVKQFKLIGGYIGGINATMAADDESIKLPRERISWTAGASVSVSDKLSIDLNYVHRKNAQMFDRTIMVGVAFKAL